MGGEPWRNTAASNTLIEQVNARWPNRDKSSDGTIGDAAHAARESDHNPDADGWVHARDIDKDGIDADALADQLVALARARKDGGRLKNIVFKGRVASGTYADKFWVWRDDPDLGHQHHLHISFTDAAERDGSPFPLDILETDMPLSDEDVNRVAAAVWRQAFREFVDENGNGERDPRRTADILYSIHRLVVELGTKSGVPTPVDSQQVAEAVADELADRLKD